MNTQDNKQMEAERELDAAWDAYAKKSGLLVDGVAQDPAKTQTAFFAFEYAWKAKPAAPQPPVAVGVDGRLLTDVATAVMEKHGLLSDVDEHATQALCEEMHSEFDAALAATPSEAAPAYGCHCDLEEGQQPDGCVIDTNRREDCVYASRHDRKEQCKYWQPIKVIRKDAFGVSEAAPAGKSDVVYMIRDDLAPVWWREASRNEYNGTRGTARRVLYTAAHPTKDE